MDAVYANGGEVAASNGMAQAQHVLNWNPKQLDIKTKSVEKTLEPLVLQVSTGKLAILGAGNMDWRYSK